MKRIRKPLLVGILVCLALGLSAITVFAAITNNEIGTHDGYDYEFWKDYGGSGSMTLNSGGTFTAQWSNVNNILFRKGKKFDQTQTHQQIGNMSIDFGVNYQPSGNSYLTVYGWTVDPLVEYYIVDSWGIGDLLEQHQKGRFMLMVIRTTFMRRHDTINHRLSVTQLSNSIGA